MGTNLSRREPWTVERALHMLLAAIAVMGWVVAYTVLVKGSGPREDIARGERGPMKISNLAPPASPVSPPVPAVR